MIINVWFGMASRVIALRGLYGFQGNSPEGVVWLRVIALRGLYAYTVCDWN